MDRTDVIPPQLRNLILEIIQKTRVRRSTRWDEAPRTTLINGVSLLNDDETFMNRLCTVHDSSAERSVFPGTGVDQTRIKKVTAPQAAPWLGVLLGKAHVNGGPSLAGIPV
jgi:hypothetical protein